MLEGPFDPFVIGKKRGFTKDESLEDLTGRELV